MIIPPPTGESVNRGEIICSKIRPAGKCDTPFVNHTRGIAFSSALMVKYSRYQKDCLLFREDAEGAPHGHSRRRSLHGQITGGHGCRPGLPLRRSEAGGTAGPRRRDSDGICHLRRGALRLRPAGGHREAGAVRRRDAALWPEGGARQRAEALPGLSEDGRGLERRPHPPGADQAPGHRPRAFERQGYSERTLRGDQRG